MPNVIFKVCNCNSPFSESHVLMLVQMLMVMLRTHLTTSCDTAHPIVCPGALFPGPKTAQGLSRTFSPSTQSLRLLICISTWLHCDALMYPCLMHVSCTFYTDSLDMYTASAEKVQVQSTQRCSGLESGKSKSVQLLMHRCKGASFIFSERSHMISPSRDGVRGR